MTYPAAEGGGEGEQGPGPLREWAGEARTSAGVVYT